MSEVDFDSLVASERAQADKVRLMKKQGATVEDITNEVAALKLIREQIAVLRPVDTDFADFDKKTFEELILRKMFVVPSFQIHGGVSGLYDFGPPGCALKNNMTQLWRHHFITHDTMLEMECTNLTPYSVLDTSGHVDKFCDLMVKDEETKECFRADKLLEDAIDAFLESNPSLTSAEVEDHRRIQRQADAFTPEELHEQLTAYSVVSPATGNPLSTPFPFNLMFQTTIGPEGNAIGFLRPETAQGLFVNFKRLLDFNYGKVPFAAAQIGLGFRNEISPQNGLLRVREFTMAEIEHFVHPQHKETPKFDTVRDVCLTLFSREDQLGSGKTKDITIGEAVAQGMVDNETLGYFMARSFLYMRSIGIKPSLIRYRQHLRSEMAHYASDCWDLEIKTTYGWIECVGHADRACYDLEVHAERTRTPMTAAMHLEEPIVREVFEPTFDKKLVGKTFKRDQKRVIACIEQLCEENEAEVQRMDDLLSSEGSYTLAGSGEEKEGEEGNPSSVVITREMVTFAKVTKREHEEKFTPSVIEPSFGIGRILYALLEHAFSQRKEDEQRIVMRFRPSVAPVKVSFLPLMTKEPFLSVTERFCQQAIHEGHTARVDVTSAAIGRKYARSDELGIPFCVTVDGDTLVDHTVTLRERDHMSQIRLPVADVAPLLKRLCESSYEQDDWARWVAETAKYELITPPIFENGEEEEERKGGEGSGDEERKEEGAETSSSSSSSSHRSHSASLVVEKMSKARFSRPKV